MVLPVVLSVQHLAILVVKQLVGLAEEERKPSFNTTEKLGNTGASPSSWGIFQERMVRRSWLTPMEDM